MYREEVHHRELHREHEGDRGDAGVLQREGINFNDRNREDGLY